MARVLGGIALVLLGFFLASRPILTSMAVGVTWGALLIGSAVVQLVVSVVTRPPKWGWMAAASIVPAIAGAMMLYDPVAGVLGISVLVAAFLLVAGAVRLAVAANWYPLSGWGWMTFHGLLAIALGLIVVAGLPTTGFFLPGTLLAIETISTGISVMAGTFEGAKIAPPRPHLPV